MGYFCSLKKNISTICYITGHYILLVVGYIADSFIILIKKFIERSVRIMKVITTNKLEEENRERLKEYFEFVSFPKDFQEMSWEEYIKIQKLSWKEFEVAHSVHFKDFYKWIWIEYEFFIKHWGYCEPLVQIIDPTVLPSYFHFKHKED